MKHADRSETSFKIRGGEEGGLLELNGEGGIAGCNFMHVQHPAIARSFGAYVKKDVCEEYGLGSFPPLFYLQLQNCSFRCDHSFFFVDGHFFKGNMISKLAFFMGHALVLTASP